MKPTHVLIATCVLVAIATVHTVHTVQAATAAKPAKPASPTPGSNDFPTVDRVLYVQECMRNNPGPTFEMVNKCSCALDRLASEVRFDDYVSMSTIGNAISIGGERGGQLRDNESLKPHIARLRELQARVRKACLIGPP